MISLEKKKIVLVEGDPLLADIITEVLTERRNETEIILMRDGMEAVDYFQELGDRLSW